MASLIFLLLLFACVLAHEFGHIFTARAFGVATPDVTLLPIGGVARLERIPEEPREEFLIAIAGPLVNVAIAFGLVAARRRAPQRRRPHRHGEPAGLARSTGSPPSTCSWRVFNMIPAFPMDGGRVLRALLATRMGYVRATEIAATIGQGVAFALGFIGLFYNPILIFIAIFVYLAAAAEAHMVAIRAMSRGVPVSTAMMTQYATLAAGRAGRRGGADAAAHQPERVPGGRRQRQAGGPARPRRSHPRAQGARSRLPASPTR